MRNRKLWKYKKKQWYDNAHLWSVVFQGQRLFRSDTHVEITNRIRKHSERNRPGPVRADLYVNRTIKYFQSTIEQYIVDARNRAADDALSVDAHQSAGIDDENLQQEERWSSHASMPPAELQLSQDIARIQQQV